MERIFTSPSRYVQGKGVLTTGIHHIKALGKNVLLISDDTVFEIAGKRLQNDLKNNEMAVKYVSFNGEASEDEIQRITKIGRDNGTDVVIGLGGGKTIDSAKGVSDDLNVPVAILPTIASTDAPTSALSVIYSDEGVFEKYRFYKKNPDLVLVDTEVVAKGPVRLLISGIADATATWVEGRSVIQGHGDTMVGGTPTLAAEAIAEKCSNVLFENGLKAVTAAKANLATPALEAIVEANTLLSGIGFESCGLAAAHAIHNGFIALTGDVHSLTHGEKVAYGTLTQLILENRPKEELDRYITFYQKLGLPTTLNELKLGSISYERLLEVGKLATQEGETIHQMGLPVDAESVTDALFAVDAYVNSHFA